MSMVISEDSWIDESIGSLSILSASPTKGRHSLSNSKYNNNPSSLNIKESIKEEEDHESSIIDEHLFSGGDN